MTKVLEFLVKLKGKLKVLKLKPKMRVEIKIEN